MKRQLLNLSSSRAAAAILLALVVNVYMAFSHPFTNVPTANLDTGEVNRAITALEQEDSSPHLVLLGSSLLLAPVMQAEANFLAKPIARMTHRRSSFLESQLADLPLPPKVFCLAMGGQMVSDAYFLVEHALKGKHQPDAIIFGIAPRDVQDNLLPGVQSTESFKLLAGPADTWQLLTSAPLSFQEAADVVLSKVSALWKYRSDARLYALLRSKKMMEASMPWVTFEKLGPQGNLRPSHKGQFPEEAKGTLLVCPHLPMINAGRQKTRFEYIARYHPINQPAVDLQFDYLARLLCLCKQRNVKLLVVNMPLCSDTLSLVPTGFYPYYMTRLKQACDEHGTEMVDMCSSSYASSKLYPDGVHLDSQVSAEFLQALSKQLHASRVAASFNNNI